MTVIADTYQAPIAVTSPRYPPSTVRPACELKAPIAKLASCESAKTGAVGADIIYLVG